MSAGILFTLLASVLCLLPPHGLCGDTIKAESAAAPVPEITWHAAGSLTVPFEYFRKHIYVTIGMNGKPGFIFMLDSGANRNILNLRTARQLGIAPKKLSRDSDIGFGDGRIYIGPDENVFAAIGSVPVARVMSVMDLNGFEQHFHHRTDGMLGYPFLRQFVVKLDFERKLLTLLPPDRFRYRGLGIELPLKASNDFVVMPATVGNAHGIQNRIDLVVDSGSNMTLMLYERTVRPLQLESSFFDAQPEKAFGLNGYYSVTRGNIASFALGGAETQNLAVDYLPNEEEVESQRGFAGAIGNGILQSFQLVIFDVPHRHVIFQLKPPPWLPGVERTAIAEP